MGNNFLQFDSENANILTQEEYLNDTQRINGASSGIARSKLFNKAVRQSTTMAAAIGEIISERGGDATEDITALKAAILDKLLAANGVPLSTETANLYGLSGVDANVDKALATISNIKKVVSLRNTNVVSGVGVLLSFNQIDQNIGFDVNLSTQPTRLTIPLGVNKILLCGTFVCDNGTGSGGRGELHVRKNGVDSNEFPIIYGAPAIATSDVIQFSSSFSKVMAVNPGDYFQIYGYFSASKNFNFKANCSLSAINLI